MARCPSHPDKRASLSVRALDDGTILLHCFAECLPIDVCAAIGVELYELFPAGVRRRRNDEQQDELRLSARDALAALSDEVMIVAFVAADMVSHKTIDEEDWHRLATAARRISDARALIVPARLRP
jgi:hypothetical protein